MPETVLLVRVLYDTKLLAKTLTYFLEYDTIYFNAVLLSYMTVLVPYCATKRNQQSEIK